MLKVESVNLHCLSNSRSHRTNKFEICSDCIDPTPVLRRGQPFHLSITFDRPFQEQKDIVRVYFKCIDIEEVSPRNMASHSQSTVTRASQISRDINVWSLALLSQETNHIHLKIKSPAIIPFATYKLFIETKAKARPGIKKYQHPKNFYFLFNPWEKDDDVYMPDTKLLDEYVLNDVGKIYVGSSKKPKGEPWVFGQFAKPILPALILAMKGHDSFFLGRGNPVLVARDLTAQLCASDSKTEIGVLRGVWKDGYNHTECTDPVLWNDSVSIFEEYFKSEGKPVQFGKCWVFSAITTTACRAIGIPCRSVTNFGSAQDADSSMAVEIYTITKDKPANELMESEKIWEFHCWNDVWMSRNDLPDGYGGWQAIDSCPVQTYLKIDDNDDYFNPTTAKEIYSCGPTSLVAIKKGEINHIYETAHMTAQINADVINYVTEEDENGDIVYKVSSIDTNRIGKMILTKRPYIYDPNGETDVEDITNQYKELEGTKEERLTFYNALRQSANKALCYNFETNHFCEFHLSQIDSLDIGEDILVSLEVKNGSSLIQHTVDVYIIASTLYYNGIIGNKIKKISEKHVIKPDKSVIVKMRITAEEYAPKLVEHAFVKVFALAKFQDINHMWSGEDHFVINLPEIAISTKSDLKKDKEGVLLFTILNPLKRRLTGCQFVYEASGVGKHAPVACRDILPEEEVTVEHTIIPGKKGKTFLTVRFDCKQLKCVTGRSVIKIT